jgi:transcriptional regulator with XRE-family HTH domain
MKERKELNIKIGERIKHSREIAGYTQEKLADLTDVSIQYISDLERGIVGTSIPTLIKICETLNVSSDFLLMGRTKENNLSDVQNRLLYLPEPHIKLVDKGINLILEAIAASTINKASR